MTESALIVAVTIVALCISSIAGYGGSLVLVPALSAALGPRVGVALAALLLGWNNVFKVIAYRRTLAIREGWRLIAVTIVGVWLGSRVLITSSNQVIAWSIVVTTACALIAELVGSDRLVQLRRRSAVPAMAASGVFSGVSGSSGPLKGVAIRALGLGRMEHVGLAACVSLVADALKVSLFAEAGLFGDVDLALLFLVLPAMPLAAWLGRTINERVDEHIFRWVFWSVVGGYTMRMLGVWV